MLIVRTPWYYGWTIVAVAITYQAIVYGIALYSFTFWVPLWEDEFGTGRGDVMLVFIAMQAGLAVLAPFAGKAADSLPLRWLVLAGGVCFAMSLILSSYAQELWQIGVIFAVLTVAGLVLAGPVTALTLVARWFNRNSGMALGVVSTGTSIGGLLLPLLVVYLQAEFGWREANLWLAGLVVSVIVPASLLIYGSPADAGIAGNDATDSGEDPARTVKEVPSDFQEWTFRSILLRPTFWAMMFCFIVVTAIFVAIQQNLAPLAKDNGVSAAVVSSVVAVMAFVMIGAKLLFGFFADRVKLRTLYLISVSALVAVLLLLTLREVTYPVLMITGILVGVAGGSLLPLMAAMIRRDFGPLSFGRVKGLSSGLVSFSAIGPWVAGSIYDATGSYDLAWIMLGLLLIPAFFVSSGLSGKRSAQLDSCR
ncbi:MAG: MFS transporter [Gammaproteobacteria bacterium]|jgi:MFS family permease|nr:hypothetical protein [Gammaproteobacteria bacterium]MDP6094922.1 MFS transporter [Gammaproteobacteria bacterium]